MKDKIANITRWITILLLAFVALSGILFYLNIIDSETFINAGKLMLIIGVAVMVISPIYGFIINPSNIVKILISLGVAAVVVIIGYTMASNTFSAYQLEELNTTAETSKMVGVGLWTTYISFGLAVIAILYSSIIKLFK